MTFKKSKKLLIKSLHLTYPRWMDIKTACSYASLSKNTLMKLMREGHIRAKKLDGKWIFDRESIDTFMQTDDICVSLSKLSFLKD